MILYTDGKPTLEIDDKSLHLILSVYPEEKLIERKRIQDALSSQVITYDTLLHECDVLQLPWQLFLLDRVKLQKTIDSINNVRKSKFDMKKIANRHGASGVMSMRIVDRLVKLQEFAVDDGMLANSYCGSLKDLSVLQSTELIVEYFGIDIERFNHVTKEKALEYLIRLLENCNIRVSRGVLTNKILPMSPELQALYKQSSGFALRDEVLPYIFLPSEANRDETAGRQIYTLLLLLVLIGLDEYNVTVKSDFKVNADVKSGHFSNAHRIVSELLLPSSVTDTYLGRVITPKIRDELSNSYNLTPSAVVVTLYKRGIIETKELYAALLDTVPVRPKLSSEIIRSPLVKTAATKFCGATTNGKIINQTIRGDLPPTQAQYLLFGHANKKKYQEFRIQNKL